MSVNHDVLLINLEVNASGAEGDGDNLRTDFRIYK